MSAMAMLLTPRYVQRSGLSLEALSLDVPAPAEEHPNKAPFRGILTRVDEPSTRPPTVHDGHPGHRVLIPRAVAEVAGPSLVGMPINCSFNLKDHDKKFVIGIIESWRIEGRDFVVEGYLLEKNYPEEVALIRARRMQLGMSYEIADVIVEDAEADVWVLTALTFTGAAILDKAAAAYEKTAIVARTEEETLMPGDATAILEELKTLGQRLDGLAAAGDEDDETKKQADEDATKAAAEAARAQAEADAVRKAKEGEDDEDEDAAGDDDADANMMPALFAMLLRGMQRKSVKAHAGRQESADEADSMARMLGRWMLKSMAYPGVQPTRARRKAADAVHEDEDEDVAMFRRLMQQYTKMDALGDRGMVDLETRRLRQTQKELQAAVGLLTDTLKKQTGLITDMQQTVKNLATDQSRGKDGGPVRKTVAAGAGWFVGPFDGREESQTEVTLEQIDAALDKAGMPAGERMNQLRIAKKIEAQMAGTLK